MCDAHTMPRLGKVCPMYIYIAMTVCTGMGGWVMQVHVHFMRTVEQGVRECGRGILSLDVSQDCCLGMAVRLNMATSRKTQ